MAKKVSVKKTGSAKGATGAAAANAGPSFQRIKTSALVPADWNYKEKGTPEMIEKLARSIQHDRSLGVVAVRDLGKGRYEVIDGNHRLEAARLIGMDELMTENFGRITKAQAILISRRRNHQWFKDDAVMLAGLYAEVVLPEVSIEELESFMPETRKEIEDLIAIASGDLPDMGGTRKGPSNKDSIKAGNSMRFTGEQYGVVMRAVESVRVRENDPTIPDGRAVELICADFLSGEP